MKILDWLRPGIRVKRWALLAFFGVLLITMGVSFILNRSGYQDYRYKAYYIFLIVSGVFFVYIAVTQEIKAIIRLVNKGYLNVTLDSDKIENLIYEKRLLIKGPKIVVIGGGTGLSTMLRGLKFYTSNITAIVTVSDDGGGSGVLREDLGMLPPGDIRNCILALADTEPLMEDLLQYRFTDGRLKDQSFGNLFLAALDGISNNFEEAVRKMSKVLAVTGKVVPVTLEHVVLKAKMKNGMIVEGESNIPKEAEKNNTSIDYVFIEPQDAEALKEAVTSIEDADAIIFGPGSLYTSVIPNLLVKDIANALYRTKALKLYVANIMTQPGETEGYDVADHIIAINKHLGKNIIDYAVVNIGIIDESVQVRYEDSTSKLVDLDEKRVNDLGVDVVKGDYITVKDGLIRHNAENLASILIQTIMDKKLYEDKMKIIEYFYLSGRLKEKKKR